MASGLFANFNPYRHGPPLFLASMIAVNGFYYPFVVGPQGSLLKFGWTPAIAKSREAGLVNQVSSARISHIGIAVWWLYLKGQYQAIDICLAAMAWIGAIDVYVMNREGAEGSVAFRGISTAIVATWGLLGSTSGRSIFGNGRSLL